MSNLSNIIEELHKYKESVDSIINNNIDAPIDLADIPNKQGINLSSVKDIEWEKQDNGELTYVKVNYEPANPEKPVLEAQKSKEVFDLEDCVSKNLKKMLYRIPEFSVSELSDKYVITIKPDNMDMKTIGSAAAIKRWVKASGVPFSNLKCGKFQHDRLGNELWCEVYKAKDVNESAGDKQLQHNCKSLIKMIDEVDKGVRNKIEQIEALDKSGDSHSVTAGQLDDLRMSLEDFITGVMKLKV